MPQLPKQAGHSVARRALLAVTEDDDAVRCPEHGGELSLPVGVFKVPGRHIDGSPEMGGVERLLASDIQDEDRPALGKRRIESRRLQSWRAHLRGCFGA